MAQALADAGMRAVFSYAGRTAAPVPQPLPTRIGGFGGVEGLVGYLRAESISHVIDATHPFAARMSLNAHTACVALGVPLLRFERPAWEAGAQDRWTFAAALEDIPALLPDAPARVFLAIGKQQIALFASKPQHHYLLRLVDAPEGPLPLPNTSVVLARGPFNVEEDTALLRAHAITHVVTKNAGGAGARAKLEAARALGLQVILAQRPALPDCTTAASVKACMDWLTHHADRGV